jgi:hypothetical protein
MTTWTFLVLFLAVICRRAQEPLSLASPGQLAPKGEHASFADAHEYGRGLSSAKYLARPHMVV